MRGSQGRGCNSWGMHGVHLTPHVMQDQSAKSSDGLSCKCALCICLMGETLDS